MLRIRMNSYPTTTQREPHVCKHAMELRHQRQHVKLHQPLEPSSENHRSVIKPPAGLHKRTRPARVQSSWCGPNTHNPGNRPTAAPPPRPRYATAPAPRHAPDMSTQRRSRPPNPLPPSRRPAAPPADSAALGQRRRGPLQLPPSATRWQALRPSERLHPEVVVRAGVDHVTVRVGEHLQSLQVQLAEVLAIEVVAGAL